MWNWLQRLAKRQRDLRHGVDADLVRGNPIRRRSGALSTALLGMVLVAGESRAPIPAWAHLAIGIAGGACLLLGLVVANWALQERALLNKPGPEEPPRMFKLNYDPNP